MLPPYSLASSVRALRRSFHLSSSVKLSLRLRLRQQDEALRTVGEQEYKVHSPSLSGAQLSPASVCSWRRGARSSVQSAMSCRNTGIP